MQNKAGKSSNIRVIATWFIALVFLAAAVQTLSDGYKLLAGSYLIRSSDIYLVDTFKIQDKAYYNGPKKYHSPYYQFKSTDGYSFTIGEFIYKGIKDKSELYDTLLYHELPFIAYSDKRTVDLYRKSTEKIDINVYQLQIGSKKYIDIHQANKSEKSYLIRRILIALAVAVIIIISYFKTGRVFKDL